MNAAVPAAAFLGGAAFVYFQFANGDPVAKAAEVPAGSSKLKKTLSGAGLFPQPEEGKSKLKPTPSGSMAAFTQGSDPVAGKGTGTPM